MAEPRPGLIGEILALAAAEPELARRLVDPRPTLVTAAGSGSALLWANPAAVARFAIADLADPPPAVRAVLAAEPGRWAPLPLGTDPGATVAVAEDGEVAADRAAAAALLCRLLRALRPAAVVDAAGAVVAGEVPAAEAAAIDLGDGWRLLVGRPEAGAGGEAPGTAAIPTRGSGGATKDGERMDAGGETGGEVATRSGSSLDDAAAAGGLSRPEWEAFRQVALALGARFEGDAPEDVAAAALPEPVRAATERATTAVDRILLDRILVDRIPLPLIISRGEEILHVNAAALAFLGHRDRAGFAAAGGLGRLLAGPGPSRGGERLVRVRLGDGGTRAVSARLQSIPWNGGTAVLVALFAEDRGQAPDRTPLDAVPDPVVILDEDGTVLVANRAAVRVFGDGLVGEGFVGAVAESDRLALSAAIDALFAVADVDAEAPPSTGLDFAALAGGAVYAARLARADAGERRVALVLRDVTGERAAAAARAAELAAAREASQRKSDLLARVGHEIRTPMNAIIGFSDGLIEGRFGAFSLRRQRDYLRDMRACGEHVVSLLDDLLDIAKIEAGGGDLAFEPVALGALVDDCAAMMRTEAASRRVILRVVHSAPAVVLADRRAIRQIVLNLLSNAIRFNVAGGQVIATVTATEGGARLRVADTGVGMTAEELALALEPFRQVNGRGDRGGTGLGLPLAKALVEAHAAAFDIRSAPGRGTQVDVTFPAGRLALPPTVG